MVKSYPLLFFTMLDKSSAEQERAIDWEKIKEARKLFIERIKDMKISMPIYDFKVRLKAILTEDAEQRLLFHEIAATATEDDIKEWFGSYQDFQEIMSVGMMHDESYVHRHDRYPKIVI